MKYREVIQMNVAIYARKSKATKKGESISNQIEIKILKQQSSLKKNQKNHSMKS
jgi:hypothetical protein